VEPAVPEAVKNNANVVTLDLVLSQQQRANLAKLPQPLACINQKNRMVLEALLNHCFDQCNDALFLAADKAQGVEEQNLLFDANRLLSSQLGNFKQYFLGGIDIAFSELMVPVSSSAAHQNERLEPNRRVDPVGWMIPLEATINECLAQNQLALASINTRIGSLLAGPCLQNPLNPSLAGELIKQQIERLKLPSKAIDIIIDVFKNVVFESQTPIYAAIENILDQYAVAKAKDIDNHFAGKYVSQLSSRQLKTIEQADPNSATAIILNSVLRTTKATKMLAHRELINVLDVVQRELGNATTADNYTTIIALITQTQNRLNISGELTRYDRELIRLVNVLFDLVTREDNLEPLTKGYINRLLVPVIKVALVDKTFFNESQHPVRRLLNELIFAGLGWQQHQDPKLNSENIRLIDKITRNIVDNFGSDIASFEHALELLSKFQTSERRQLSLLNTRLNGTAEGKARALDVEKSVDETIKLQLKTVVNAPIINVFANKLWRKVLLVTAFKEGTKSPIWLEQCALLNKLCHLVTPCLGQNDKIQRSQDLPVIIPQIQSNLTTCAHNAFESAEILEELHRTLCECLKGNSAPTSYRLKNTHHSEVPTPGSVEICRDLEEVSPSTAPAAPEAPSLEVRQGHVAQKPAATTQKATKASPTIFENDEDKLLIQEIMKFTRGAIFNWEEPNKGTIRCQLAAIINQTNRYIFINRNGIKVVDLAIEEMMSTLRSGQLKPINNSQLFDKALEEVVTGLRRSQSTPLNKHH
jgi:hypothetical protein